MSLKSLEPAIEHSYYAEEFIKFIEDNISYFKKPEDLKLVTFEPSIAYKFEGDFYGLLHHLGYPRHLHYLIMRINSLESPLDYDGINTSIMVYTGGMEVSISKALSTKTR